MILYLVFFFVEIIYFYAERIPAIMMEKQQIMNKGWRGGRQERKVGGKFFFVSNWQNVKNQDGTKFSTGTFVLFLGRQSVGLFYISLVLSL